jgi:hypothetical protein
MLVRVTVSAAPQPGASAIADAQRRRAYQGRAWRAGTRLAYWSGVILLTLSGAASHAQVLDPLKPPRNPPWNVHEVFEPLVFPDWWDRDERDKRQPEDRPVKVRQHPGYESVGLRAGSWMVYPSMTLGGLFDSNIFASNIDKRSDLAAVVAPTVRAHTLWERHEIDLQASARSYFYRENPGLDQNNASLTGRSRIDIAHDRALLSRFEVAHLNIDVGTLSSPAGAVQPTPYDLLSGDVAYRHEFNRLTVSVGGRATSYNYGLTRSQDGRVINQDNRDGQVYALYGRADYALSPKFGFFGALEGNRRDLRGTPDQTLSSDGYRTLGGAVIQFSPLVMGEIGVGYSSQRFDDSAQIPKSDGPTYRSMVIWSPTRLIDVWFKAEQLFTQISETSTTSVRARAVQLGIDYELLRNVIVSTSGMYEADKFIGQLRDDDVYSTRAEVRYLPNRFSSIALRHNYTQRDSNIPTISYDKHEVSIHVTARF